MNPEIKKTVDAYRVKDVYRHAEENNLRVVVPCDNELQIDIDSEADLVYFHKQFAILISRIPGCVYMIAPSRNKPEGKHITVTVPSMVFTPIQRVAFQAALGSDRVRELLSSIEIHKGSPLPTIFFEKK